MNKKHEILTELFSISPFWAEMTDSNPLSVPEGYFDSLPLQVLKKLSFEDLVLIEESKEATYRVPKLYFETLSDAIFSRINQSKNLENEIYVELDKIAPLLNTISNENMYSVPIGYFELNKFVTSNLPEKTIQKVLPLRMFNKWMQYAAAAIVAGILVTGAFLFTDSKNYQALENDNPIDITSELKKVNDDELVNYLASSEHLESTLSDNLQSESQEAADIDNTTIQIVSDEELTIYLSEHAESNKVAAKQK